MNSLALTGDSAGKTAVPVVLVFGCSEKRNRQSATASPWLFPFPAFVKPKLYGIPLIRPKN
jgi:hypothetical protein